MSAAPNRVRVQQEWQKARAASAAASRNSAAGDYDTAANRLYYAAMHAAKAVLLTRDLEPKNHRGIKQMLIIHFVGPGLLSRAAEPSFSRLETERDLADYATGFTVHASASPSANRWRRRFSTRWNGCCGVKAGFTTTPDPARGAPVRAPARESRTPAAPGS